MQISNYKRQKKSKRTAWLVICQVKHHVFAAVQKTAIPSSTKADKARFDTLCSGSDVTQTLKNLLLWVLLQKILFTKVGLKPSNQ